MPRSHSPYPEEFRKQMVDLVRSGRTPESLAKEFEPTAQSIRNWVVQADRDEGRRGDGLTSAERAELTKLRGENRRLRQEREILKKSRGLVRQGERVVPEEGFRFVSAHRAEFPVATMCRVLGLSTSGYYAWRRRDICRRKREDARLLARIRAHHAASKGRYGAPKIHADLVEEGWQVGRKRVARLMREDGLVGVTRRRWVVTTRRGRTDRAAPDRVERDFTAERPDQLWVADITYIPTWSGFLYLAVVLDVFSRRIVGWSMAGHLRAELVLDALEMAIRRRQPSRVIHHSDQGCQYTSLEFGEQCRKAGIVPSMGSVGDCYDNAMAESFFATLECELLQGSRFRNHAQARRAVFEFIEGWYNPRRRHQSLGQVAPMEFEKRYAQFTSTPKPELSTEAG